VGDSLNICRHKVMVFVREIYKSRAEAAENAFYEMQALVGSPMLDDDLVYVTGIQEKRINDKRTNGCPTGETVGPCMECNETMWTSGGRYFSNASFSGALTEVWPATTAPNLVARSSVPKEHGSQGSTSLSQAERSH